MVMVMVMVMCSRDVATVRIPFGRNHDDDDEGWACARARRVVG
jgi:hypothetical protein